MKEFDYKTILNSREVFAVIIRNGIISISIENCNCYIHRKDSHALTVMTTLN